MIYLEILKVNLGSIVLNYTIPVLETISYLISKILQFP